MTPDKVKQKWEKISTPKVHARCEVCGHGWKLYRGDAFVCPACSNSPDEIILRPGGFVQLPEKLPSWSAWYRL